MKTHSLPSSENRASADTHKGNGISLPAAQLYRPGTLNEVTHRISDNGNMAVRDGGDPNHFFAKQQSTSLAPHVLRESGNGPNGTKKYRSAIDYDNDCGAYASAILKEMYQVNFDTHSAFKRTKNATVNSEVNPMNYINPLFAKQLGAPARPVLGEVYLAINNPNDFKIGTGEHYNFHWAAIVAQDGNDVITCEAAPGKSHEFFQMYNESSPSQTFLYQHVVSLDKLVNTAKVFTLTYHQRQKQSEDGGTIED
jgi:hypothetical protein